MPWESLPAPVPARSLKFSGSCPVIRYGSRLIVISGTCFGLRLIVFPEIYSGPRLHPPHNNSGPSDFSACRRGPLPCVFCYHLYPAARDP